MSDFICEAALLILCSVGIWLTIKWCIMSFLFMPFRAARRSELKDPFFYFYWDVSAIRVLFQHSCMPRRPSHQQWMSLCHPISDFTVARRKGVLVHGWNMVSSCYWQNRFTFSFSKWVHTAQVSIIIRLAVVAVFSLLKQDFITEFACVYIKMET